MGKIIRFKGNSQDLFKKFYDKKIPIENIYYWIIGLPGNSKKFKINNIGKLEEVTHMEDSQEYIIKYHKYNNINPSLPINIEFNNGKNNINIKIYNWIIL